MLTSCGSRTRGGFQPRARSANAHSSKANRDPRKGYFLNASFVEDFGRHLYQRQQPERDGEPNKPPRQRDNGLGEGLEYFISRGEDHRSASIFNSQQKSLATHIATITMRPCSSPATTTTFLLSKRFNAKVSGLAFVPSGISEDLLRAADFSLGFISDSLGNGSRSRGRHSTVGSLMHDAMS
jgi:hypothetical protein